MSEQTGLPVQVLKRRLLTSWRLIARPSQIAPDPPWSFWFLKAGRGFGKTLTAAQWVKETALRARGSRWALIAPTFADVRDTMVEGEALALDTLVQTPEGAVPIGLLQDGDLVLGGDGKPCRVVHAHPVLLDRPCYRVRLKGGVEVVADANHRWLTEDYSCRSYTNRHGTTSRKPKVVTTEEMRETLRHYSGAASQANHGIRVATIKTQEVELPIDPYVLGAWLGDGLSRHGAICDAEGDVVDQVRQAGYETRLQPSSGTVNVYGVIGLQTQLRQAGLIRNKHVPAVYLRGSAEQRLALVQGLMDTDGYVSERGQCEFVNKRRELADALVDLLCGLGIKASAPRAKATSVGTTHWLVKFTTTATVFRMERKLRRIPARARDANHWHVATIEPTDTVPVRCLTVDSVDRTYLITRHYVQTHNTGLLSILPAEALAGQTREVAWNRSIGELTLASGTRMRAFSSETPDRLRGPQHHYAWGEEVSSWLDAHKGDVLNSTFSNLKLGLRLGEHPSAVLTSTPKTNKLTHELVELCASRPAAYRLVEGSSYENRANLSDSWWAEVVEPYEGTRIGMQEIMAILLEDVEGALWTKKTIDELRVAREGFDYDSLERIIVGVDPNASSDEAANSAGIVVAGVRREGGVLHGYVLQDVTVVRGGPTRWAAAACEAYHEWGADKIVAEKNNGGEMVTITIHAYDEDVPVKPVTATRGKRTRAEPVSLLYQQREARPGRIHHVGSFPELEAEMTTWTPESDSPDRMDALVWAFTDLFDLKMKDRMRGQATILSPTTRRIPTATERVASVDRFGGGGFGYRG